MAEVMPFGFPNLFKVEPIQSSNEWGAWVAPIPIMPEWADDENKKKLYGIELAKDHPSPFVAACKVFAEDTSGALWVSINWINDPVVVAAHDLYLKTLALDVTLLDKSQLGARLLHFADEKSFDPKDRLSALKLYAEVSGFIGKVEFNSNSFTHNEMKIVVVRTEKKEETLIDTVKPLEIEHDNYLPVKLKLVK